MGTKAKIVLRAGNLVRTWEKELPEPMIGLVENMVNSVFDVDEEHFPLIMELANALNWARSDKNGRDTSEE